MFKDELQAVISGIGHVANGGAIQAISGYLREGKESGTIAKEGKFVKEQEAAAILKFCRESSFFVSGAIHGRYLSEGAEQKVYLNDDGRFVTKFNDAIYYLAWQDYFNSLLLHNYFFPATGYELIGFHFTGDDLYACVKQPYVTATEETDGYAVRELLLIPFFT